MKESTLLSTAKPSSSIDQIHKIQEHIEMNGHEPKFERHNTAWTDGSLLKKKTQKKKTAQALLSYSKTDLNNYYRDQLLESLNTPNSLPKN
jgi:hypothetical protein